LFNNDHEYAASKLHNTVVKVKDPSTGLLHVDSIVKDGADLSKAVVKGSNKFSRGMSVYMADIEFAPGPLGYLTTASKGLIYLVRSPIRRDYKQGLRANQLAYLPSTEAHRRKPMSNILNAAYGVKDNDFYEPEFLCALADCLHSSYKKIETAVEMAEETGFGQAFSKQFAISDKFNLEYRGLTVGTLLDNGRIKLGNEFSFLEQELETEAGNGILAR